MEAFAEAWLSSIYETSGRSLVLMLAALLVARILLSRRAADRLVVWTVTAVLVLAMPALLHTIPTIVLDLDVVPSQLAPVSRDALVPTASREAATGVSVVFAIWAIGCAVVLGRLLLGYVSFLRMKRGAIAVGQDLLDRLGLDTGSAIYEIPGTTVPLTFGFMRPSVFVPSVFRDWSSDRQRATLIHEFAHIRRKDCLWQLLVSVMCAIHWFNPLAWLLRSRMLFDQEVACDDEVIASGILPSSYGGHLIETVRSCRPGPVASLAFAHRSRLERRLSLILSQRWTGGTGALRVGGATLCLVACAALAVLRVEARPIPLAIPVSSPAPADLTPVVPAGPSEGEQHTTLVSGPPSVEHVPKGEPARDAARTVLIERQDTPPNIEGVGPGPHPDQISLLVPSEARPLVRTGRRSRSDERNRFMVGVSGGMLRTRGVASTTSKGIRALASYRVTQATAIEMTVGYSPMVMRGQVRDYEPSGPGIERLVMRDIQQSGSQLMLGVGVRQSLQPGRSNSLYWGVTGGIAHLPGTTFVRSDATILDRQFESLWGYFVRSKIGATFEATRVKGVALDLSAGIDMISRNGFTTLQQMISVGFNFAL